MSTNVPQSELTPPSADVNPPSEDLDPSDFGEDGPPEGWEPPVDGLTADTMLGRENDSSDWRGTVQKAYTYLKPGTVYHLKNCPLCPLEAGPLPKGHDVTVERLDHSIQVTIWGEHNHPGEKQTKGGKWVSNHEWSPPLKVFKRGDHVELGRALAEQLGGRGRASSTHEYGIRVYDRRDRGVKHPEGGSWRPQENEVVEQAAARFAGRLVSQGDKKPPRPICLRANDLGGIVKVAKNVLHETQGVFDSDWLGFTNGDLHLNGRGFEEPAADHRVLEEFILPFPFSSTAQAPEKWITFLWQILGDVDKIMFFQEFLGACLHGKGAEWQTHPLLVGAGANGKSTLLKVIRALFKQTAVCSSSPSSWSQRFGRGQLATAWLNLVTDLDEKEMLRDSGGIKAILAADPIEMEKKYKDPVTRTPLAGHVFACNRLPTVADRSHGFFRRFVVLQFDRVFAPHEQDHTLETHLTHPSVLSGIYTWARQGFERRRSRGTYTIPKSHEAAVRGWREQSDSALAWASACLQVDPAGREPSGRLYQCYRSWCERTGHRAQGLRSWGETMATEHSRRHGKTGNYFAVKLIPDESLDGVEDTDITTLLLDN